MTSGIINGSDINVIVTNQVIKDVRSGELLVLLTDKEMDALDSSLCPVTGEWKYAFQRFSPLAAEVVIKFPYVACDCGVRRCVGRKLYRYQRCIIGSAFAKIAKAVGVELEIEDTAVEPEMVEAEKIEPETVQPEIVEPEMVTVVPYSRGIVSEAGANLVARLHGYNGIVVGV